MVNKMIACEKRFFVGIMILGIAYYYKSTESQRLDGPIVDTHYGKLKGIRSDSRQGRSFYEFLGIPYAAPPINELRFEVSSTHWKYKHQNILETNMDIMFLKEKLITFSLTFSRLSHQLNGKV